MKKIIFLVLLFPAVVNAQFKRSATELAKENIQEYVTGKLFKNASYQSVSYGELTSRNEENGKPTWSIEHRFVIKEVQPLSEKKDSVQRIYRFMFYFDNKMNVLKAESFFE